MKRINCFEVCLCFTIKDVKRKNTVQLLDWSAALSWVECWYCHYQQSETLYKHRTQDRKPEFLSLVGFDK